MPWVSLTIPAVRGTSSIQVLEGYFRINERCVNGMTRGVAGAGRLQTEQQLQRKVEPVTIFIAICVDDESS